VSSNIPGWPHLTLALVLGWVNLNDAFTWVPLVLLVRTKKRKQYILVMVRLAIKVIFNT